MPEVTVALARMDWQLPTEIQAEAIPQILGGGDVLMASETGTGKTGAFCIPIVQVVYEERILSQKRNPADIEKTVTEATHLSIADRDPEAVLSNDLLTIRSKSGQWQGCRSNKGVRRLKGGNNRHQVYFEVYFADPGLARVGWSFANARLELGTDHEGWGYGGTAKKSNNRQFSDYGQIFGEKFDIIGCILDLQTGDMIFTKNGRSLGTAFNVPVSKLETREIYPTVCVKNAGCQLRFGPVDTKDDYKPSACVWVDQIQTHLVNNSASALNPNQSGPLALILEPSRELAKQTYDCLRIFSTKLGIECVLMVGGGLDEKSISQDTHIVVCTPGRLTDATSKGLLPLNNIHFFILDEVDGLLQQGFENLVRSTASRLPRMFSSGRRLQIVCCSATLHNFQVKKLAQDLMHFPCWIDLKGEDSVPETVHHVILRIDPRRDDIYSQLGDLFDTDKVHERDNVEHRLAKGGDLSRPEELSQAVKLMKFYYTVKAIEALKMDQGIIFCRTKLDCDNLFNFMRSMNDKTGSDRYSCVRLHSSLSQQERTDNLNKFKRGEHKFLICTDVAARGIDIKGIPFVIQVTLPDEKANYLHRIGRVGRAERMGLAVSLVASVPEKVWYHSCKRRECSNTKLVEKGGCCIWFDELAMLSEIEEHLKCVIQEIEPDFKVQVDEYDGKVVYGARRLEQTSSYEGHVEQLKSIVNNLTNLESQTQLNYLRLYL